MPEYLKMPLHFFLLPIYYHAYFELIRNWFIYSDFMEH
jgi:hypothetical protein